MSKVQSACKFVSAHAFILSVRIDRYILPPAPGAKTGFVGICAFTFWKVSSPLDCEKMSENVKRVAWVEGIADDFMTLSNQNQTNSFLTGGKGFKANV